MPTYRLRFYDADPASIFTTTVGSTFTWTGGDHPTGTATITDNETGIEGTTLDDDSNGGETATANVTIDGTSSTGTTVDAEIVWTLRDTVTGEEFQVAQFDVENGGAAGFYTLSEVPLIDGRVYEVVEYDTNPDVTVGDPAFSYTDYVGADNLVTGTSGDDTIDNTYVGDPEGDQIDDGFGGGTSCNDNVVEGLSGNDTITSGAGDDTVYGGLGSDTVDGGDGADTIYGDSDGPSGSGVTEFLDWSAQGADESDLRAGFTQNTGEIDVTVAYTNTGDNNPSFSVESTTTTYAGTGEPFDTLSSAQLSGDGDFATANIDLTFAAAAGSTVENEVQNVSFRINDIDEDNYRDQITINAYDALGNPVAVSITAADDNVSGNTVTASDGTDAPSSVNGSALIEIAGPVASIEIIYRNSENEEDPHSIYLSDVHYEPIFTGAAAADTLSGGAGDDLIYGEQGDDTLSGDAGADTLDGGAGDDTIDGGADNDTIYGGTGADTVEGGTGDDVIYGDSTLETTEGSNEFLDWSAAGADEADISAGFTQSTGDMDVTIGFTDDGDNNPTFTVESTDTIYTASGEPYDPNSSAVMFASGAGPTSTVSVDFAAAAAGVSDEVQNVSFRLSDIDSGAWQDIVTVNAYDADGNPVAVTLTPAGNETVSGDTITAGGTSDSPASANGSVLVEIAGPVASIEIVYSNGGTSNQLIHIGDVHFETIPVVVGDDDILSGGDGADTIYGEDGNDTITGGTGDDTMTGGAGDDTYVLDDGSGADTITDFDVSDTDGDGFANDQFDVTALTDAEGNPVNAWDVTVSDDGSGNALLTFPNGETVVLQGVTPAEVTGAQLLNRIGIPCFAAGTLIRTPGGERPIEWLREGDLVCTKDSGPQPVLWVGRRHLGKAELEQMPELKPIHIQAGAFGNHTPLLVSPQHGMLMRDADGAEVLARARHLAMQPGPVRIAHGKKEVSYVHLLFEAHQIVFANGAASESFYPGPCGLKMLSLPDLAQVMALFPRLASEAADTAYGPRARRFLTRKELSALSLRSAA